MNKDQIAALSTIAIAVGSVALFATMRMKARKYIWQTEVDEMSEKTPATVISINE